MQGIGGGTLILALGMSVALAQDERRATPAERYQLLRKEQQDQPQDLSIDKTAQERQEALARLRTLPLRFVELAEENPKDPVVVDALTQALALVNGTSFPAGGEDSPGERAMAILLRDHVRSDRLGPACRMVLFGFRRSHETFLRTVLEKNPHREVQGLACLSLAQYLTDRLNRLEILESRDEPALVERYHRAFGEEFVEELRRQDRAAVAKEAEALYARAAENYRDVEIPVTYFGSGGTVGEESEVALFQIRHLAVGRQAPEIEGEDQDGKRFKLSDYRGKVVLIDFWHHT